MSHIPKHNRHGFAIILAMFITMAFMLVMADMMKTLSQIEDYNRSSEAQQQAQLNAQMGLELGLLIYNHPESVNIGKLLQSDGTYKVAFKDGTGSITVKLSDSIISAGKACPPNNNGCLNPTNDGVFVYPFPGTGKVGGDRCDPNKISGTKDENWYRDMWYFYTNGNDYPQGSSLIEAAGPSGDPSKAPNDLQEKIKDFKSLAAKINVLDHPCFWNYVHEGADEEIMLYRKQVNPGGAKGPDGKGYTIIGPEHLETLTLTVKLPCDPSKSTQGQICTDEQRYTLNLPPQKIKDELGIEFTDDLNPLKTVLWYMVSNCEQGGKPLICSMLGAYVDNKSKVLEKNEQSIISYRNLYEPSFNTTTSKQNGVWSVDLLDGIRQGVDQTANTTTIEDFLTKTYKHFNPVMRLGIANPLYLKDTSTNNGPQYINQIQYQLTYTTDGAIGTKVPMVVNPVVISTSRYKGYTITLETSLTRNTGTYGYSFVGKSK